MGRLDNRVAFVTGAGRGIGAATAIRLAEEGARVVLADIDTESSKQVAAELERLDSQALVVSCNVADKESVEAAVQQGVDRFGRLDILVNNAGVLRDNLLFKMSDDDWETVINVHLRGAFLCSRAAQAHMVKQRYGRIISLSSTSALGNRGQANYSTAKAGLQGLARTLAIELGQFNINVNAVAPGFIETRMTQQTAERVGIDWEQFKKDAASRTPVRRTGKPEDVANVIAFLVSDESSFVSGQIIYVAGGPRG